MGADLLGRVSLRGDEAVIDAGCGTGRVTELLLGRLPGGTVLAVDSSEAMVGAVRERFAGDARVRVEWQDLLELEVEEPVDVIFSTATFHWIKDHALLFRRLARALKSVVLGHHLEGLPETERDPFSAEVAARLAKRGMLVVDYICLNVLATRSVPA